jgi:hypothetical protein
VCRFRPGARAPIGHYEGDTLVIDTVGFKIGPFAMVDWYGTPRREALHVVERYRLLDHEAAKEGMERLRARRLTVIPMPSTYPGGPRRCIVRLAQGRICNGPASPLTPVI